MKQIQRIDAKGKKINRSKNIFYWTILAFPLLQFAIFYIGVNLNSFVLAFQEFDMYNDGLKFVGFDKLWTNFEAVFRDFKEIDYL